MLGTRFVAAVLAAALFVGFLPAVVAAQDSTTTPPSQVATVPGGGGQSPDPVDADLLDALIAEIMAENEAAIADAKRRQEEADAAIAENEAAIAEARRRQKAAKERQRQLTEEFLGQGQ